MVENKSWLNSGNKLLISFHWIQDNITKLLKDSNLCRKMKIAIVIMFKTTKEKCKKNNNIIHLEI